MRARGYSLSPLVFGFVIDKTGNWELPFLGSIGLLFFGSILAFWMKPEEALTEPALPNVGSDKSLSLLHAQLLTTLRAMSKFLAQDQLEENLYESHSKATRLRRRPHPS